MQLIVMHRWRWWSLEDWVRRLFRLPERDVLSELDPARVAYWTTPVDDPEFRATVKAHLRHKGHHI